MHIVITGISGFLGSALAAALVARGHQVTGLVRSHSPTAHLRPLGLRLLPLELTAQAPLAQALAGQDLVVHAAAKVHNVGRWTEYQTATIQATQAVVNAACQAKVARLLHVSTVGVYGFPARAQTAAVSESTPPQPIHRWNYYSRSKAAAELLVQNAQAAGLLAATIVRPTWIYGAGDQVILGRLRCALRQGRYRWIGNGQNRLSMIERRDAVAALVAAIETPAASGQVYNLAADELSPTQAELIQTLCAHDKLPFPKGRLSYPQAYGLGLLGEMISQATGRRFTPPLTRLSVLLLGGQRRFDSLKAQKELSWTPQVGHAQGLAAALAGETAP